jgi:hypothetical protein
MLRLSQKWVDYLVTQGETGMGYQDTDVTLVDGRVFKETIVCDCEWAYLPEDQGIEEPMITDIKVFLRGERPPGTRRTF